MDIREFARGLDEEAMFYLSENNNSRSRAFANSLVERLKDQLGIENYVNAYDLVKNSSGNTLGEIYGYAISGNGEVLTLIYSLYNGNLRDGIKNINNSEFQIAPNRLQGYYQHCLSGSVAENITQESDVYELSELLYNNRAVKRGPGRPSSQPTNSIVTVRLLIFSNSFISDTKVKRQRISGRSIMTEVYDIAKLYQLFNTESDHLNIDVVFGTESDEYNYNIPYIKMEAQEVGYKCFLAMFPGKLLERLYKQYNTNLLLNNVRYFLGFKGSEKNNANIGILKTLREEKHMFLAYNNGIVALANEVETLSDEGKTKVDFEDTRNDCVSTGVISAIRDFQIVNGGQTTASIFNAKNQSGDSISLLGVYVPVKIIVINGSDAKTKEVAANITRFSNSQSKVKYADFSASNPYNVAMQELSRSIRTNNGTYWYYERLRGQYDQESARIKSKEEQQMFKSMYDKKERLFRKELLAKVWKCYQDTPYDVVKGEGTNYDIFLKYVVEKNIQPDEAYYKKTIGLIILWNFIYNMPDVKKTSNCRAPLTAYTMAYMLNNRGKEFDLLRIWENQSLDDNLIEFILKLSRSMMIMLDKIAEESQKTVLSCSKTVGTYEEIKRRGVHCDYSLIDYYFI